MTVLWRAKWKTTPAKLKTTPLRLTVGNGSQLETSCKAPPFNSGKPDVRIILTPSTRWRQIDCLAVLPGFLNVAPSYTTHTGIFERILKVAVEYDYNRKYFTDPWLETRGDRWGLLWRPHVRARETRPDGTDLVCLCCPPPINRGRKQRLSEGRGPRSSASDGTACRIVQRLNSSRSLCVASRVANHLPRSTPTALVPTTLSLITAPARR
jgi:hypothetical protein